ncbi:hypothetical protein ACKI14_02880 [Streptomyces turgidiscabies]|uniref:hypothetical protein n=1 Tax=Streptomyces turgidiscabies TaxID=85558 RepID=UPI0038F80D1C
MPSPASERMPGALLPLPTLGSLAPGQIRGASCVWCPEELNAETAIDFGACHGSLMGQATIWYPRACAPCVSRMARKEFAAHPRTCEQCVDDPTVCADRKALRRLALETRR